MRCMFSGCSSLTKIDLSNFNTQNAIAFGGMFKGCKPLKKDDVITNDKNIFREISKLIRK